MNEKNNTLANLNLKIVTYNTQFSIRIDDIVRNIKVLSNQGVNVFCLQEILNYTNKQPVLELLISSLGKNWKSLEHLGEYDSRLEMGNAILWDSSVLALHKSYKFELPQNRNPAIHEILFALLTGGKIKPYPRRVVVGDFNFNSQLVRITSVHLDHTGGTTHRNAQLKYLLNMLSNYSSAQTELICGDFNSFDLLKSGHEHDLIARTLGINFIDSGSRVWTADLFNMDLSNANPLTKLFIRYLNIHIRRKLDYIWIKGADVLRDEVLYTPGSDHNPLVADISI